MNAVPDRFGSRPATCRFVFSHFGLGVERLESADTTAERAIDTALEESPAVRQELPLIDVDLGVRDETVVGRSTEDGQTVTEPETGTVRSAGGSEPDALHFYLAGSRQLCARCNPGGSATSGRATSRSIPCPTDERPTGRRREAGVAHIGHTTTAEGTGSQCTHDEKRQKARSVSGTPPTHRPDRCTRGCPRGGPDECPRDCAMRRRTTTRSCRKSRPPTTTRSLSSNLSRSSVPTISITTTPQA